MLDSNHVRPFLKSRFTQLELLSSFKVCHWLFCSYACLYGTALNVTLSKSPHIHISIYIYICSVGLEQCSCSVLGLVIPAVDNCLHASKLSKYVTNHLGQLSLLSSVRWYNEYRRLD